jgi:hypothetical protein
MLLGQFGLRQREVSSVENRPAPKPAPEATPVLVAAKFAALIDAASAS